MNPYVEGTVVTGDRRGRLLGFPTANVAADGTANIPEDGVYAGTVELDDGTRHVAAISVGRRPQYYHENGIRLVEAYLLDFDGDLYGRRIVIHVGQRVRGQLVFDSTDDLVAQMARDVEMVRRLAGGVVAGSLSAPTAAGVGDDGSAVGAETLGISET